jgi:hypothetical protein
MSLQDRWKMRRKEGCWNEEERLLKEGKYETQGKRDRRTEVRKEGRERKI